MSWILDLCYEDIWKYLETTRLNELAYNSAPTLGNMTFLTTHPSARSAFDPIKFLNFKINLSLLE